MHYFCNQQCCFSLSTVYNGVNKTGKCDVIKHLCDMTASAFRRLILTNDMKFTQNIQTSSLPMMSLVHDLREGSLLGYRWHNVQPKRTNVPLVAHFLLLSPTAVTVMKQTGLSLAACWTLLFVTIQRSTADVKAPRSVTPRVRSTWDRENTGRKNVL